MKLEFGYGNGVQIVEAPEKNVMGVLLANPAAHARHGEAAVRFALEHPIGAPRLREGVRPGQKIAIVASDVSRPVPSFEILPAILDELAADLGRAVDQMAFVRLFLWLIDLFDGDKIDLALDSG